MHRAWLPTGFVDPHQNQHLNLLLSEKKKSAVFIGVVPDDINHAVSEHKLNILIRDGITHIVYHPDYLPIAQSLWALIEQARQSCSFIVELEHAIAMLQGYTAIEADAYIRSSLLMFDDLPDIPESIGPHEGHELELMLAHQKHVAMFESVPAAFMPLIQQGVFEVLLVDAFTNIVFYPTHTTQAEELAQTILQTRTQGMNKHLERRIGELLGYDEKSIASYLKETFD